MIEKEMMYTLRGGVQWLLQGNAYKGHPEDKAGTRNLAEAIVTLLEDYEEAIKTIRVLEKNVVDSRNTGTGLRNTLNSFINSLESEAGQVKGVRGDVYIRDTMLKVAEQLRAMLARGDSIR